MRTGMVPEVGWLVLHVIMAGEDSNRKGKDKCTFFFFFLLLLIQQNSFSLVFGDYFCGYKVRKIYFEMKALKSVENTSSFKVQFWGQVMHLEHENTCSQV